MSKRSSELQPDSNRPGMYSAEFVPPTAGAVAKNLLMLSWIVTPDQRKYDINPTLARHLFVSYLEGEISRRTFKQYMSKLESPNLTGEKLDESIRAMAKRLMHKNVLEENLLIEQALEKYLGQAD